MAKATKTKRKYKCKSCGGPLKETERRLCAFKDGDLSFIVVGTWNDKMLVDDSGDNWSLPIAAHWPIEPPRYVHQPAASGGPLGGEGSDRVSESLAQATPEEGE